MGGFGVAVSGEWALCSAGCDDVRDSVLHLLVIEVVEKYLGLGLRHCDPAIRVDGEPCDDDLQLRVTWKVVTVVTGRAEEIGVEPAIVSVLSLLRVLVADSG